MEIKFFLRVFLLLFCCSVSAMLQLYKARVQPFSSMNRTAMQNGFYEFIDRAEEKILVSIFTFFDKEAARRLVLARARGVQVRIIMQEPIKNSPVLRMFKSFRVPFWLFRSNSAGAIMHNKYIVADGKRVWIGSMNFTEPAYKMNFESAAVLHSYALAKYFSQDFYAIRDKITEQQKFEQARNNKFRADMKREREKCMNMISAYRTLMRQKARR